MGLIFLFWISVSAALDITYRRCFNWLIISGFMGAVFSAILNLEILSADISAIDRVIGFISAFLIFLIFYALRVMGAGDVKFAAVLGFWVGWKLLLPIWVLSCFFAVAHGLIVQSNLRYFFSFSMKWEDGSQKKRRKFIPYVTYLSIATVIVLMLSQ